jgi:hypothetical protein
MIYEIRDYHYRPDIFEDYRRWAAEAVEVLRSKLDVVGFWIDCGIDPEVAGTNPVDSPIGHANVTWIIRWNSKAERDELLRQALGSDEFQAVFAKHPDPNGYRQMLSRFMEEMGT